MAPRKKKRPKKKPLDRLDMYKWDIVAVAWDDAFSVDSWTTEEELINHARHPKTVLQVGSLLNLDKNHITLTTARDISKDKTSCHGGTWSIPLGMVREVKVIKRMRSGEKLGAVKVKKKRGNRVGTQRR